MELTPAEGRVLGCLLEKQVHGPDAYSLTLNELRFACNQTSGRQPVVAYDDRTVEETLTSLKSKGLARFVPAVPSGRGQGQVRCRHRADERWRLNSPEMTVLAVLLLRGEQTVEDVRALVKENPLLETRSEVEAVLDSLAGRTPTPFVTRLRPGGNKREVRWVEVLTGWPEPHEQLEPVDDSDESGEPSLPLYPSPARVPGASGGSTPSPTSGPSPLTMVELADRLSSIERRLAGIETALGSLRKAVENSVNAAPGDVRSVTRGG